jgi:protein-S-isoprenylcysteine O-methyltransferase Ste14
MDTRLAAFVLLHAMGSTAGLLFVFHAVRTVTGGVATTSVRRDYGVGGLLVVVGFGLRFLLAPTAATPDAIARLPGDLLRPVGVVLAAVGAAVCLWALARLARNRKGREAVV